VSALAKPTTLSPSKRMTFRTHMDQALSEAETAALRGEVPVGAVVVSPTGDVIAAAGNRTRELNDPTAHAEMLAIRAACATLGQERRVAKLARIQVAEDKLPELANEFSAILGFIEQLNEVDVDGVEPMTSVTPQRLKRRDDVVTDGSQPEAVLKNAPDAREGFFAVPKVVE